jgi:protein-tyrosine phosphatase
MTMEWRDLVWAVRGRAFRNPQVPPDVANVLFICTANLCRSPFAAAAARQLLVGAMDDKQIAITSAGLRATPGRSVPPAALACAAERGIDLRGHRTVGVTSDCLERADMIVVMEPGHVRHLRRGWQPRAPMFLLSLFDADADARPAYERYHIEDPVNGDNETFHRCFARVETAVRALMSGLSASPRARLR